MTDLLDPRVEALFDAVADLPEEERARVLAGCEEELRRRVQALLDRDTPSGLLGAATMRPLEEHIGTRIGAYDIVSLLGEGGMGTVYLAEQREPIQRRVALKIIKLGMDTRRVIARFEMERQVLALLDHPNIARVLDAGATDRGRPFFVMELVEGDPLTRYCDARSLGVPARLRLFLAVCRAVQHAHQRGTIHRDLKPSNVLVREVEGEPVPKVIDFGVAKATAPETGGVTGLTEHQQVIGTPEYMSPEQAGFGDREVDTRSDIYSLGVLLYELLTGVTPRKTPSDVVAPTPSRRVETLGAEQVAARRACTPRTLRRHLRGGLDWVALKCLEAEKERRYESAAALARDVEAFLAHEPLAAGPPNLRYRVRTFVRRHRTALGVVALVAAVVAGFVVALYRKSVDEGAARERAEVALHANQIERGRLLGMTGNLSLAEELLWSEYLGNPSAAARWALWELYWRRPCLATRDVDGDFVHAIDFHPDGAVFATGQQGGLVRLWSVDGLRCTATLEGHGGEVRGIAYSPDGRLLASASLDGTIRFWNGGASTIEAGVGLWCIDFSPDGRLVAAGDERGVARVWDVSTGRLVGASGAEGGARRAIRFDSAGRLFSGRDDGVIDVFEVAGGLVLKRQLAGHTEAVLSLALDATGRTLYSGSEDRTARAHDLATGEGRMLDPWIGPIRAIAPLPDGDVLLLSGRAVERWSGDLETRRSTVRDMACSTLARGGSYFCVAGAGQFRGDRLSGRVRLFESEPGRALRRTAAHEGIAYALAVTPRGIVTGGGDGRVVVDGREVGRHPAQVNAACATPDGRYLATASVDGEVVLRDLEKGTILARDRGFSSAGAPLAFAPQGDRFVAGDREGILREWAVPAGSLVREARVAEVEVVWLAFSPDGRLLASTARDRTLRVWDAERLTPVAEFPYGAAPWALAFSPDGRTLAAGTWAQEVHLWDVERRVLAGVLRGHYGLVRDLAFAPAHLDLGVRALVSASDDGTLKLWDLDTLTCVLTLSCEEPVYSVAFLDDPSPRLVSTHAKGTLATWDLAYYDRHLEGNREHQRKLLAR